ncbi:MAG: RNA polymerase sigma factor [Lachnospiraceae bacterium]|nr:RNA polymerase sigma factor [Lachnospiraceae bacterium]
MKEQEFRLFYEANYRAVYHYLLSLTKNPADAEDLTQEAFLKYEKKYFSSLQEGSAYMLLCRIGKNQWLNQLRKEQRQVTAELDQLASEENMEESILDRQHAIQIHEFVHQLKEPYKEVFLLRVFGELSFQQIAKLFGKSESWAKMTFYRGKKMVMEKMEEKG